MKQSKTITFRIDLDNYTKIKNKGYTRLIRAKIIEYLDSL
jgi:hypothetical protein